MDQGMMDAVQTVGDKMDAMDTGAGGSSEPAPESGHVDGMKLEDAIAKLKADDPEAAKGFAAAEQAMGGPEMVKAMLQQLFDSLDKAEDKAEGLKGFALEVNAGPPPSKGSDLFGPLGRTMGKMSGKMK